MADPHTTAALKESVRRRLEGLAFMAGELDTEDGKQLTDRVWILATVSEVCDYNDALAADLAAALAEKERLRGALPRLLFNFAMDDRRVRDGDWGSLTEDLRQGWIDRTEKMLTAALLHSSVPASEEERP